MTLVASCSRLGLGTAQFGLDYGISNVRGKNTPEEVTEILTEASRHGLVMLDTSPAYGNSEEVLGMCIPPDACFRIVTKTPVFDGEVITRASGELLKQSCERSLRLMQRESLYGLLVHHAENLLAEGGEWLLSALRDVKNRGLVEKVGVSVYDSEQIDEVLRLFTPDIMQLPVNLFDQRLLESGHLEKLKKLGVEIHARSVYLQGLLLMDEETLAPWFDPVRPSIREYFEYLEDKGIEPQAAALSFVRNIEEIDYMIVGVNSVDHVTENVRAFKSEIREDFKEFAIADEQFVNPAKWRV